MSNTIPSENILIIDDGAIDTFIAKNTLEHTLSDIHVDFCINGLQALQFLRDLIITNPDQLPDYIFLDLSMPVMDGFEFLNEFNNINVDALRKIKIYVLSSSIFTKDIRQALNSPSVSGFISKPIDSKKVKEIFNLN